MTSIENAETPTSNRSPKWIPLAMLYLGAIAHGVIQCFTDNSNILWAVGIFIAISATIWVSLDARSLKKPIPHIALFLMLIVWCIAIPVWLIWTRGVRGFGWAVLNAVGLLGAILLGFYTTLLIGWGPQALFQN